MAPHLQPLLRRWTAAAILAIPLAAGGTLAQTADDANELDAPLVAGLPDDCELVVQGTGITSELGACWYRKCGSEPVELGCGLSEMHDVAEISVSKDARWLAVVSAGEGHPVLEIVDLQALLADGTYRAVREINPYPGAIFLEDWTDESLLVTSDIPLTQLPFVDEDPASHLLSTPERFAVEVGTWKVESARPEP